MGLEHGMVLCETHSGLWLRIKSLTAHCRVDLLLGEIVIGDKPLRPVLGVRLPGYTDICLPRGIQCPPGLGGWSVVLSHWISPSHLPPSAPGLWDLRWSSLKFSITTLPKQIHAALHGVEYAPCWCSLVRLADLPLGGGRVV